MKNSGDATVTMTTDPPARITTGAATPDRLAVDDTDARYREQWDAIVDRKFIEWGRRPELLEEDDLIPPTSNALQQAGEFIRRLRDSGFPPPKRTVPDGDGGIVLERWDGPLTVSFEIDREGRVEFVQLRSGSVVVRQVVA